jgi:hypothetical protein
MHGSTLKMQLAAATTSANSIPRAGEEFEETVEEIDKAGICSHGFVSDTCSPVRFAFVPWKYELAVVRVPTPLPKTEFNT